MKIEINLTKFDYLLSVFILSITKPIYWIIILIFGTFSNIQLIIKSITEDPVSLIAEYLGLYYSVVLLFGLFIVLITTTISFMRIYDSEGIFGIHEFNITNDGLEERTNVNHSFHKWSDVRKIIKSRLFTYIVLSNRAIHIIPKRAFINKSQYNEFVELFTKNLK